MTTTAEGSVMDMREAFEAWVEDSGVELNLYRIDGCVGYYHNETALAFRAYCAGKSTLSHIGDGSKAEPEYVAMLHVSENETTASYRLDQLSDLPIGSHKVFLSPAPTAQDSKVPEALPMRPYQTVDMSSTNYKAGWNACRKAMLSAAPVPDKVETPEAMLDKLQYVGEAVPDKPQCKRCHGKGKNVVGPANCPAMSHCSLCNGTGLQRPAAPEGE